MNFKRSTLTFALLIAATFTSAKAETNFHVIDEQKAENGGDFGIYRTGRPMDPKAQPAYYKDLLCNKGITEMMVLSNNGDSVEEAQNKLPHPCPDKVGKDENGNPKRITIVKNTMQNVRKKALTKEFLAEFDAWVAKAKKNGTKIAFRCNCGCHRTGRLAAYYEMKYKNVSPQDAFKTLHKNALPGNKFKLKAYWLMVGRPLKKQNQALYEYIQYQKTGQGKPCYQRKKFCVDESGVSDNSELLGVNLDDDFEDDGIPFKNLAGGKVNDTKDAKRLPAGVADDGVADVEEGATVIPAK